MRRIGGHWSPGRFATLVVIAATVALFACSGAGISDEAVAKAEHHYRLARNYYNDRNMAMTQRELHLALLQDPDHVEARHLRGFVLMGMNDLHGAALDFQAVLRIRPDFQEARNNLGSTLIAQRRFEEAIEILMPLLEDPLYGTPWFAHNNVGLAYFHTGDLTSARRYIEKSLFLNPRFCLGFNNLGQVHKASRNRRAALEAFEKAVRLCPNYPEPYYHLGVIYQENNEIEKAEQAFDKCAEFAGDSTLGRRCGVRR
jgi:Tfp pilus assembly protein PilF